MKSLSRPFLTIVESVSETQAKTHSKTPRKTHPKNPHKPTRLTQEPHDPCKKLTQKLH